MTVAVLALAVGLLLGVVGFQYWKPRPVQVMVQTPAPAPVTLEWAKRPSPEMTVIRFVSGSGRDTLGTTEIQAMSRLVTMEYRGPDGRLGQYVAAYQDEQGVWVYRRVGVARES